MGYRVQIFEFALGWVGLGWVSQMMGRVGSGHRNGPTNNSDLFRIGFAADSGRRGMMFSSHSFVVRPSVDTCFACMTEGFQ